MYVIVGATGQVGSLLVDELSRNGCPIRAVARHPEKLTNRTVEIVQADLFDAGQLAVAFRGCETAFVITPENPSATDILADTRRIVRNYTEAIRAAGIRSVVALSCLGAQASGDTGNLLMSKMLEDELDRLDIDKVFIRPSYYYSNWLPYLDTVSRYGVLPTFFPPDLKLDMHAPADLARFAAGVITGTVQRTRKVYELIGPTAYSSQDVADILSVKLNKSVTVHPIPGDRWRETLRSAGFTDNTAKHVENMTRAVIDGKTNPERPADAIRLATPIEAYFDGVLTDN